MLFQPVGIVLKTRIMLISFFIVLTMSTTTIEVFSSTSSSVPLLIIDNTPSTNNYSLHGMQHYATARMVLQTCNTTELSLMQ